MSAETKCVIFKRKLKQQGKVLRAFGGGGGGGTMASAIIHQKKAKQSENCLRYSDFDQSGTKKMLAPYSVFRITWHLIGQIGRNHVTMNHENHTLIMENESP